MSNTTKRSEKGGCVWIRVEDDTITVENEGERIRYEDAVRVGALIPGQGNSGGFGLGLPICKQLVERMGGYISVESERGVATIVRIKMLEGESR